MSCFRIFIISIVLFIAACSKCDENQAYNKMLALGKAQGRIAAVPGDGGPAVAAAMGKESAIVSELIAQKEFSKACSKADELAKRFDINLDEEQKNMITIEQLKTDGGKGSGSCSIADAAKMQMEVHGMLQAKVNAGEMSSDIFRQFNTDTQGYAEMLSTDPSAACKLFEDLKEKYNLK